MVVTVAMSVTMAKPEVSQSRPVTVIVTPWPDSVCMPVIRTPVTIVAGVGSVAAVAVIVTIIMAMVTVADRVIGYVMNESIDGEDRRVKRHETDEA